MGDEEDAVLAHALRDMMIDATVDPMPGRSRRRSLLRRPGAKQNEDADLLIEHLTHLREFREGMLGAGRQPSFAPVLMAPEVGSRAEQTSGADRIEIVLGNGRRLIIGAGIEPSALARVVAVLNRA